MKCLNSVGTTVKNSLQDTNMRFDSADEQIWSTERLKVRAHFACERREAKFFHYGRSRRKHFSNRSKGMAETLHILLRDNDWHLQ